MAASQQSGPERLGGLPLLGVGMIEIGIAALICALWLDVPQPLVWAGVGAVLLLVGMVLIGIATHAGLRHFERNRTRSVKTTKAPKGIPPA